MSKDESIKEVQATIAINNRPRDKYSFNKKSFKKHNEIIKSDVKEDNFIEEVKKQIMYGDTGHGLLVDEKV